MESFLTSLTQTIQTTVLASIRSKLDEFAAVVSTTSEGKLTKEQVLECWNKINPDVIVSSTMAEKKVSAPRVATDKNKKCPVLKKSGVNAGQACGKNCVVGEDMCNAHLQQGKDKSQKPTVQPVVPVPSVQPVVPVPSVQPADSVPSVPEEKKIPSSLTIPGEAELKALTVVKLKELILANKIKVPPRAKKEDLVTALLAHNANPSQQLVPNPVVEQPLVANPSQSLVVNPLVSN